MKSAIIVLPHEFQSYFSPIQTGARTYLLTVRVNFNPILVRFKRAGREIGSNHVHEFQSYFSPIQTVLQELNHCFPVRFQSYFSPIQTSHPFTVAGWR